MNKATTPKKRSIELVIECARFFKIYAYIEQSHSLDNIKRALTLLNENNDLIINFSEGADMPLNRKFSLLTLNISLRRQFY